jgi:integrase/recombinase XerD
MAQNGQSTPFAREDAIESTPEPAAPRQFGVAQNGSAPSRETEVLAPGRLDPLIRRIAGLLRKAHLSAAEGAYVLRRARAKGGIAGRPVKAKRLPDVLSPDELRRILAEAYRARPRDGLLVRLLFESAVRVSEASRLEVPDVDLSERTLKVRLGKGSRDRLVLVTEDLAQVLRVHLDGRTRGPLFCSNRGTRLSVRRIQGIVRSASRRAGIRDKKVSVHTMRHTWATLARNAGMPLDTVQGILGHQDPKTTLIYSRLSTARARDEYDATMRAIAGAGSTRALERP